MGLEIASRKLELAAKAPNWRPLGWAEKCIGVLWSEYQYMHKVSDGRFLPTYRDRILRRLMDPGKQWKPALEIRMRAIAV